MNTTNFTIGQEVTFSSAYGVNVITDIKGSTVTTKELNTGMTYTKRISSLKPFVQQAAYWNEQELAHGQSKHVHGATVYSCIDASGVGCHMVWDDVKKDTVSANQLTKI